MPLNGSGTYAAPVSSFNPAVTNTTINSTDWIALLADLTTALSTAMYKDGQATPTANIPMGGFRITGLGAATASTDAARVSQVQNSTFTSLTAVAGTNTITATATPALAAYASGQKFIFIPAATNTGATTLEVVSGSAKSIFSNGAACVGGELRINVPVGVVYDGTQFHIVANGFNMPIAPNSQSVAYTTVLTDAGKFVLHPTADNNPRTFTIDSNANVAYPVGTAITFVNLINTVTIAITSDTLIAAGSGSTGSRTLTANGTATALKVTSTSWMISGSGLS